MWPDMEASPEPSAYALRHSAARSISGQIARLEETLGTKLFTRRPFALLPAGAQLYEFVQPFFDDLAKVASGIRGASERLRIAAPSIVLHDYLPDLLQRLRQRFPALFRLQLHEAARGDAERLLLARDVDMAITVIDGRERPGLTARPLLELPLILLVPRKHRLKRASDLWSQDKIEEPLITFPEAMPFRPICKRA